jgi:flagellar biogenesis protein FliO
MNCPALGIARLALLVLGMVLLVSPAAGQPINVRSATSQPAAKQQQAKQTSAPFSAVRVIFALGAVVSLIFVFKWGARRYVIGGAAGGHSRAVQVLSRTIVAPRQQLMLVKVGRRLVLVANTGAGMNAITEIRDEQEVAELLGQVTADQGDSVSKAFGSLFRREEEKFSQASEDGTDDGSRLRPDDTETPESAAVGATRDELSGLMEKVRLVSKQFRRS